MKTLAIISIVTLPLTVITSFFGMNFADTIPGFTKPLTFAAAMLLMICLPFVFLYLFGEGLALRKFLVTLRNARLHVALGIQLTRFLPERLSGVRFA